MEEQQVQTNEAPSEVEQDRPEPQAVVEGAPQAPVEQVTTETPTEAPVEEPVEEAPELYGFNELEQYQQPQQPQQVGGIDINALPKDEYGNVDANAFVQALQQQQYQLLQTARDQARQEVLETIQEQKHWEKAMAKYPDLKENKELRDLVHKQRAGAIIAGQKATPLQAADAIFKHIKTAKEQAKTEATESIRTQASAHLETSDVQSDASADTFKDNYAKISSHNRQEAEAARSAVLAELIKKKAIEIPGYNV